MLAHFSPRRRPNKVSVGFTFTHFNERLIWSIKELARTESSREKGSICSSAEER